MACIGYHAHTLTPTLTLTDGLHWLSHTDTVRVKRSCWMLARYQSPIFFGVVPPFDVADVATHQAEALGPKPGSGVTHCQSLGPGPEPEPELQRIHIREGCACCCLVYGERGVVIIISFQAWARHLSGPLVDGNPFANPETFPTMQHNAHLQLQPDEMSMYIIHKRAQDLEVLDGIVLGVQGHE